MDKGMLLEVKNLSTHFFTEDGLIKAVDGISYDLNEGETLGLVGESGCGKSVSALSLLRLVPNPPGKIVSGQAFFEGQDLLKLSEDDICSVRGNRVAMIFQEPMTSLNPVLTIGRQVMEPMELHKGMGKVAALMECLRLLTRVHIPEPRTRVNAYPHQFSGGMLQRAMIAMGLSCDPRLIIADEPTTALDVTIQAQLLELMKGLTRDFGTALIIITHNLGVVARYADRVNVMYAGRFVEKATARDLYKDPLHPYTIGLMASVPRLDQDVKQKLSPVEGQPPDLLSLPLGCAFHPRCSHRVEKCMEETPRLETVADNHEIACWVDVRER
jgi:oligopeptide/dipeptide ABC transporter ATP-binding protein